MIRLWPFLLAGCRFYDSPRNHDWCNDPTPARDLGAGDASVALDDHPWNEPSYSLGACDSSSWSYEQAFTWTPTRTGRVEALIRSSGPIGLGLVAPCPESRVRRCGVDEDWAPGFAVHSLRFDAVAGEPVYLVVHGNPSASVSLEVRELGGGVEPPPPPDPPDPETCGSSPPSVFDLWMFDASEGGPAAVGLEFTFEDPDGALHEYFPFVLFDTEPDGYVDPTRPALGFSDPLTTPDPVCEAYGPYTQAFAILLGEDVPFATEMDFAIVVVDADGFASEFAVVTGVTPGEDPDPDPPSCVPDGFEPNDDLASATPLAAGASGLSICGPSDQDHFLFSVAPGEQIDLAVTFVHALGDLDAEILDASGASIDFQAGTTDSEVFTWANDQVVPAGLVLRVFGYAGAENTYDITVTRQ